MVDWSDSLYYYVRSRIKDINSERNLGGIVQAQDWPLKETQVGAFYMLTSVSDPVLSSWSGAIYSEAFQWAWQLQGNDIAPGQQATNRGDKYRLHAKMKQELLHGLYPGFAEMCSYQIVDNTPVGTSFSPKEMIRWTLPKFSDRIDTSTGILFGSATMTVSGFSPEIYS
ncbi:MAG: hypothetical protein ACRYGG_21665 [Janthinobacterium lividum]